MKTYFPELSIEICGDMVRLEQPRPFAESDVVELHRAQLAQLVTLVGDVRPLAESCRRKKVTVK